MTLKLKRVLSGKDLVILQILEVLKVKTCELKYMDNIHHHTRERYAQLLRDQESSKGKTKALSIFKSFILFRALIFHIFHLEAVSLGHFVQNS